MREQYWFRPIRIFGCFALYYPSSVSGWVSTLILFGTGVIVFRVIDGVAHSGSDTILAFAPWAIILMLVFDLLCARTGEYPFWWKRKVSDQNPRI